MQRVLWSASPLQKVQTCRRFPHDRESGTIPLRAAPSDVGVSVGFGGLMTCGSWHSCITCAGKIAVARAEELEHVFRVWRAMGGGVILATFSCRHNGRQRLRELVEGQRAGWAEVRSDRPWKRDREALGIQWVIRAFEVTAGDEHGWHPHYHVFLLVDRPVSQEMARERLMPAWSRWQRGLAKHGLTAVASVAGESAGFDVQVLDTGEAGNWAAYPFKLALEAVGGVFKRGRGVDNKGREAGKRHRTPFEVMTDYAVASAEGDTLSAKADLQIITEWSKTANDMRFRQCPWPPGMREFFRLKALELGIDGPLTSDEEKSDEEIAAEEAPESVTVGHVSAVTYRKVIAYEMDTLRAAGRRGFPEVVRWFDQRGIPLDLTDVGETWLAERSLVEGAA